MMKRLISLSVLTLLGSSLYACGGGSGGASSSDRPGFTPETASREVGPSGGSVTLALADGTAFTLDVPACALGAPATLSLTTQEPVGRQRFNLLLEPAGLVLANGATATLAISLPAGASLPADGALVYDGALIPFTRLPDGKLEVSLSSFAGTPAAALAGAGKVSVDLAGSRLFPRVSAAASVSTCGDVPYLDTNQGLTAVDAVDIEIYGQCMVAAVQALATNEQFAEAVRVANAVAVYLEKTGAGSADLLVAQAHEIACTAYGLALERADATTVTTMGSLYDLVKPILFWETVVEQLGGTCSGIAVDAYQTVVNAKTGEAIAYYDQAKPGLGDTTGAPYAEAKAEAAASAQAQNEVLALHPPAGVQQTVTDEIAGRAQPGLVDAMLEGPWELCRNEGKYDDLIDLLETLGQTDSVQVAAQYCGTVLIAEAKDADGTVTASLDPPLGGVTAGSQRTSATLAAAKTGSVALTGPIQALQCPADFGGGTEALTVALDGMTVQTFSAAPYLGTPLTIDLASALQAAHPGTGAVDALTEATLTVERTGAPCDGFWGEAPTPLATLNLSFERPKIAFLRYESGSGRHVFVVNADGSSMTKLTGGGTSTDPVWFASPSWSPDRARLAFSGGNTGVSNIYTMNPDGSGRTALTGNVDSLEADVSPTWSPDGTRIAFAKYKLGNPDLGVATFIRLYLMNADGSGQVALTNVSAPLEDSTPAWAPDGVRIAFVRSDANAGTTDIYIRNADGSGQDTVLTDGGSPAWSPDGSRIAFSRYDASSGSNNVIVMNADGSGQVVLAAGDHPTWSPDGAEIALARFDANIGEWRIYVMNSDGTGLAELTTGLDPSW